MNWLDLAIGGLVAVSVVTSFVTGLTRELVRLAALLLGILMGLWWYPEVARYLEPYTSSPAIAGFAAFLLILIGFIVLGWVAAKVLGKLIKASGLRWFDRLLGAAFGLVRGVLLAAALVLAMVAFLPEKGASETVARSRLAPTVLYAARVIVTVAPRRLKEGFAGGLERVRQVWREAKDDSV